MSLYQNQKTFTADKRRLTPIKSMRRIIYKTILAVLGTLC